MSLIIVFIAFMLLEIVLSIGVVKRFHKTPKTHLDSITFIRYWTFLSLLLLFVMTATMLAIMEVYTWLA